ncbi:hypothetical protein Hte_011699 [Hypoxylon texense]
MAKKIDEPRHLQEAKKRAKEEKKVCREGRTPTTRSYRLLLQYIEASHHSVFTDLTVESNKDLTSTGSIPPPTDKVCRTSLEPWPDFVKQQCTTLGILYDELPADTKTVFENRTFLEGVGRRMSNKPISDDKTLEYFLHTCVEEPLKEEKKVKDEFKLGNGIIFENHVHAFRDAADEVINRQASPPSPAPPQTPVQPAQGRGFSQIRPDQICVYQANEHPSGRTMLYRLTPLHLCAGLHRMDIYKDIANRKTIPTADETKAKFLNDSEMLAASALTQTYHYMIESGLQYGLLTTGETIVFLMWTGKTQARYTITLRNQAPR